MCSIHIHFFYLHPLIVIYMIWNLHQNSFSITTQFDLNSHIASLNVIISYLLLLVLPHTPISTLYPCPIIILVNYFYIFCIANHILFLIVIMILNHRQVFAFFFSASKIIFQTIIHRHIHLCNHILAISSFNVFVSIVSTSCL
jgi:hypothetical protein